MATRYRLPIADVCDGECIKDTPGAAPCLSCVFRTCCLTIVAAPASTLAELLAHWVRMPMPRQIDIHALAVPAAEAGRLDFLQFFIAQRTYAPDFGLHMYMEVAIHNDDLAMLEWLYEKKGRDLERSLLPFAVKHKRLRMIQWLVGHGLTPDHQFVVRLLEICDAAMARAILYKSDRSDTSLLGSVLVLGYTRWYMARVPTANRRVRDRYEETRGLLVWMVQQGFAIDQAALDETLMRWARPPPNSVAQWLSTIPELAAHLPPPIVII